MSRRGPSVIPSQTLVSAQSLTSTFQTASIDVTYYDNIGMSLRWFSGSTPVGNLQVQGSNDNSNFADILAAAISVSGNSGLALSNINQCPYRYIRVSYVASSGTGSLEVLYTLKSSI